MIVSLGNSCVVHYTIRPDTAIYQIHFLPDEVGATDAMNLSVFTNSQIFRNECIGLHSQNFPPIFNHIAMARLTGIEPASFFLEREVDLPFSYNRIKNFCAATDKAQR